MTSNDEKSTPRSKTNNQLQSQIDTLTHQNSVLMSQVLNLTKAHRCLSSFLVTKTMRIKTTNIWARNIIKNLDKYDIIVQLKKNEKLGVENLQRSLDELLRFWSRATIPQQFTHQWVNQNDVLPHDQARPVFQLKNYIQHLSKSAPFKLRRGLHTLVYAVDYSIWEDINSFVYLRPHTDNNVETQWESYLSAILTIFLWNHFKDTPVRYPADSEVTVNFDCPDTYALAMIGNVSDLRDNPCPEWNEREDQEEQLIVNPKKKIRKI